MGEAGTIVKLNYREPDWPDSKPSAPYQICMDLDERLIFAPFDEDMCVRKIPQSVTELAEGSFTAEREIKCTDEGELCPLYHVCADGIDCPDYHYCGQIGRMKTRLRKKLKQKQLAKERRRNKTSAA